MNRIYTYICTMMLLAGLCLSPTGLYAAYPVSGIQQSDTLTPEEAEKLKYFDDEVKALLRAKAIIDSARKLGNVFEKLTSESLIGIPFPLVHKTFNNVEYSIVIGSIKIRSDHISLEVYGSIRTPQGKEYYFGAPEINFSGSGGLVGTSYLGLISNATFNLDNKKTLVTLKKFDKDGSGTYLAFDCDGFKFVSLDARLELSRDWVLPLDGNYNPKPQGRVACDFHLVAEDFNDWLIDISLPDFALTDFPKIAYSIEKVVFDFSDSKNAANMAFPPDYFEEMDGEGTTDAEVAGMSQQQLGGSFSGTGGQSGSSSGSSGTGSSGGSTSEAPADWRGIYVGHFKIVLPPEFADRTTTERIAIEAHHIIIDSRGVSGAVEIDNVLPLSKGRAGNWAFSLDKAGVSFYKSRLKGFYLNGKVELPIADTLKPLMYAGQFDITGRKYLLEVKPTADMKFPVWKVAKVDLLKSSYIKLVYADSKFFPTACLSGKLTIMSLNNSGKKELEAPNIIFQNLMLSSQEPYIAIQNLSLGGDVSLQGSPISLKKLGFGMDKDSLKGFFFTADVNIEKEGESGVSAGLGAAVLGKVTLVEGRQQWSFKKLDIQDGSIAAKFPGFEFRGSIKPFSNEVYGTGFQAELQLKIDFSGNKDAKSESNNQFLVEAFGIFGNKKNPDIKYWLVDVKAEFPCIPIFTGVQLCGIMGGAYRRMTAVGMGTPGDNFELGVLPSGVKYEPDADAGLGIRAGVKIRITGGNTITGSALFEFAFSESGSLDRVFFQGMVEIQVPIDKIPGVVNQMTKIVDKLKLDKVEYLNMLKSDDKKSAAQTGNNQIKATLTTNLIFEDQYYHSTLEVFLNVANGYLKGFGMADMLADFKNDKYHFYLGTFDNKISLAISISGFQAQVWTYTMFGNDIAGIPPLDPNVAKALNISPTQNSADAAAYMGNVATGTGMLFGAGLGLSFENCWRIVFVNVYAKASFDAAFEAGILDFGEGKKCKNGTGPIGKDGWYTFARSYLIIAAEGGRRKNCSKDYNKWVDVAVGVFLEGSFPNPNYILAKGIARFCGFSIKVEVQKGEKCL